MALESRSEHEITCDTGDILIRGGRVVDPGQDWNAPGDVLIESGRIKALTVPGAGPVPGPETRVIEATGLVVVPGLIDMHVHLREPGDEDKESILTGTAAAAAGGFTTVAAMPNTRPVVDNETLVTWVRERAIAARARVIPVAAMTLGQQGRELANYAGLAAAGAVAVSDDGRWVSDAGIMRQIIEAARIHGLTVVSHAEEMSLTAGGAMNEGTVSTRLGLPGIPAAAEEIAVFRDIKLAELTGAPVHLAHVSTAGACRLIAAAKAAGVPVTAETAPHYLHLTDEAVAEYGSTAKMNPPLRTAADVAALRSALADGTLDAVATDHAPHRAVDKEKPFTQAAFGVVGLETALPLILELLRDQVLTWPRLVTVMSLNPARILGLPTGTLAPGRPADLTLIDPLHRWICRPEEFSSRGRHSPFAGRTLIGRAVLTMLAGRVTHVLTRRSL